MENCKIKKIEHFCLNEHYANIYKLEGTSSMTLVREQVARNLDYETNVVATGSITIEV